MARRARQATEPENEAVSSRIALADEWAERMLVRGEHTGGLDAESSIAECVELSRPPRIVAQRGATRDGRPTFLLSDVTGSKPVSRERATCVFHGEPEIPLVTQAGRAAVRPAVIS